MEQNSDLDTFTIEDGTENTPCEFEGCLGIPLKRPKRPMCPKWRMTNMIITLERMELLFNATTIDAIF